MNSGMKWSVRAVWPYESYSRFVPPSAHILTLATMQYQLERRRMSENNAQFDQIWVNNRSWTRGVLRTITAVGLALVGLVKSAVDQFLTESILGETKRISQLSLRPSRRVFVGE